MAMLLVPSAPGVRSMSRRLTRVVGVKLSVATTAGEPETVSFSFRSVVGNHGHAVGAVGARSALDVEAADEGGGSEAVGGDHCGRTGDGDFLIRRGHLQLKVNDRHRSRDDRS